MIGVSKSAKKLTHYGDKTLSAFQESRAVRGAPAHQGFTAHRPE